MKGPPGDNFVEERCELLVVHESHFPEMIRECPRFTAHTVHFMIDRARRFNASDLQEEKMVSLGKLAAGLAHELNNPASAAVRGAKLLLATLSESETASRAVGAARLSAEQSESIEHIRSVCVHARTGNVLSSMERADREEALANWLTQHGCSADHAFRLVDTDLEVESLETLAEGMSTETLNTVLGWFATGCETRSLATDIEHAATRIHQLVDAVKRFTQMDNLAAPEAVDIEAGLRDTLRIVASKARAKKVAITLQVEPDLPRVRATAGELNQIWLNLVDNALDALTEEGAIQVSAYEELNWVVVCVADDGPGIPPDIEPQVFDAFFTTKQPGQGIGLGLEITRRLVRRYLGDITVKSQPGHTEFRVSLPADESSDSAGPTNP
jgi:signal transduction histidine kinase